MTMERALVAAEAGRSCRESSTGAMRSRLATLVRGSSMTDQCHAATALLTREYQGDHRRQVLTPATTRHGRLESCIASCVFHQFGSFHSGPLM